MSVSPCTVASFYMPIRLELRSHLIWDIVFSFLFEMGRSHYVALFLFETRSECVALADMELES